MQALNQNECNLSPFCFGLLAVALWFGIEGYAEKEITYCLSGENMVPISVLSLLMNYCNELLNCENIKLNVDSKTLELH